jgi:O-antigen/teichoic acid export membrane protein
LSVKAVWKICTQFSVFGLLILAFVLPIFYYLTNCVYHFEHSITVFLVGGLYVLPFFTMSPIVYKLMGMKKEKTVMYTSLIGALINLVCSYMLIGHFGIIGALLGGTISNWLVLFVYANRLRVV